MLFLVNQIKTCRSMMAVTRRVQDLQLAANQEPKKRKKRGWGGNNAITESYLYSLHPFTSHLPQLQSACLDPKEMGKL